MKKRKKSVSESNMIEYWQITELIQERTMHGGNKKGNDVRNYQINDLFN